MYAQRTTRRESSMKDEEGGLAFRDAPGTPGPSRFAISSTN
jgi:hypothetical protein